MKLIQTALLRYALFLAIFIALKSLIAWELFIDWKDFIFAAIWTIISVGQSQRAEKREKEADRLAEERRKNDKW